MLTLLSFATQIPSVDTVTAIVLLAEYEHIKQSGDVAFATISMAIRMAYEAGLDQEPATRQELGDEQLARNNIWWMLVICERAMFALHSSWAPEHVMAMQASGQLAVSKAALDTASRLMVDIAITHNDLINAGNVDAIPPTSIYTLQLALRHIDQGAECDAPQRLSRDALETLLCALTSRWNGGRSVGANR
ncbi:hypothetical protein LTR65_003461 [Meristemomyces frigidus]